MDVPKEVEEITLVVVITILANSLEGAKAVIEELSNHPQVVRIELVTGDRE